MICPTYGISQRETDTLPIPPLARRRHRNIYSGTQALKRQLFLVALPPLLRASAIPLWGRFRIVDPFPIAAVS